MRSFAGAVGAGDGEELLDESGEHEARRESARTKFFMAGIIPSPAESIQQSGAIAARQVSSSSR
jgi:hypothetical protein